MSVFDEIYCKYPLKTPGANELLYQTKDTPAMYGDLYEIREDGTLWHRAYDSRLVMDDSAPLGFYRECENLRWEQVPFVGELEIHHGEGEPPFDVWYSFRFWFRDGVVRDVIELVEKNDQPSEASNGDE